MKKKHVFLLVFSLLAIVVLIASFRSIQDKRKESKVGQLIGELASIDPNVRQEATRALTKIGPEAVPALIKVLGNANRFGRSSAALALGEMGREAKEAVPALIKALDDEDRFVRTTAALTLGKMGREAKEAVPALIKALDDENRDVRLCATLTLGKIGPEAKKAIPVLQELSRKDTSHDIRRSAEEAIRKIEK